MANTVLAWFKITSLTVKGEQKVMIDKYSKLFLSDKSDQPC